MFITFTSIAGLNGGSLENKKYYYALKNYSERSNCEFETICLDDEIMSEKLPRLEKSMRYDVQARMQGHSSFLYPYWRKHKKSILEFKPDVVVLARTRLGFIAKDIKAKLPNCIVITNVENIEVDYIEGYFAGRNSLLHRMAKWLEKRVVSRDEAKSFAYSDWMNFLTLRDKERAEGLYGVTSGSILPICLENKGIDSVKACSRKRKLLFLGSLGYASNIEAIRWFIEKVWVEFDLHDTFELVIGGSGASSDTELYFEATKGCNYIGRYDSAESVIESGAVMLAPIKHGAGMKVKVAEAIRLGVPIVATEESLMGYNELNDFGSPGVIEANTAEEFFHAIMLLSHLSTEEYKSVSDEMKEAFVKLYSFKRSEQYVCDLLDRFFVAVDI